jgi:hypothetical protein
VGRGAGAVAALAAGGASGSCSPDHSSFSKQQRSFQVSKVCLAATTANTLLQGLQMLTLCCRCSGPPSMCLTQGIVQIANKCLQDLHAAGLERLASKAQAGLLLPGVAAGSVCSLLNVLSVRILCGCTQCAVLYTCSTTLVLLAGLVRGVPAQAKACWAGAAAVCVCAPPGDAWCCACLDTAQPMMAVQPPSSSL